MDTILTIKGLSKYYGQIRALDNFSLEIPRGSSFGILGPNGSGKTTLLGILLDITRPTAGQFEWDLEKQTTNPRLNMGALLETPNFYPYLNAEQNMAITSKIKGDDGSKTDELLKMVNLYARRKSRFKTFSLGMKQRLAIAAAMVGDPEVLIFDEPTNGLDPEGIAEIRNIIQRISGMGKTIIMASHILDEVEKICSHVAIIRRGQLLQTGTVGNILKEDVISMEVGAQHQDKLMELLRQSSFIESIQLGENGLLHLDVKEHFSPEDLNKFAFDRGIVLNHLKMRKRKLEEEFLNIIRTEN